MALLHSVYKALMLKPGSPLPAVEAAGPVLYRRKLAPVFLASNSQKTGFGKWEK
jgi:hypothetical protein